MNLTFDDGYQFGLGAFETVSLVKGQPVWLEAHEQSCAGPFIGWASPFPLIGKISFALI